jgi:hypothetical protein
LKFERQINDRLCELKHAKGLIDDITLSSLKGVYGISIYVFKKLSEEWQCFLCHHRSISNKVIRSSPFELTVTKWKAQPISKMKFNRGDNATEKFFRTKSFVPLVQPTIQKRQLADTKPAHTKKTAKDDTETDTTTFTEDFDVISLDDLLMEADVTQEKKGLIYNIDDVDELEWAAFRSSLQCCMVPVASTVSFGSNAIIDLKDVDMLLAVLRDSFPWIESKDGDKTILEKEIKEMNRKLRKCDLTRDVVLERMAQVEEDRHYFYKPENFEVRKHI